MKTITIELPESSRLAPEQSDEEFARELRLAAAIHWYSRGLISQGKGAEIAGLDRRSFLLALGDAGVDAIQTTPQELREEVQRNLEARRERLAGRVSPSGGPAGPAS